MGSEREGLAVPLTIETHLLPVIVFGLCAIVFGLCATGAGLKPCKPFARYVHQNGQGSSSKCASIPSLHALLVHTCFFCVDCPTQISSVKVRLSLQRAKDSFDNVYVGVKPGQMLLDLMMRMDSAHIKVRSCSCCCYCCCREDAQSRSSPAVSHRTQWCRLVFSFFLIRCSL